VDIAYEEAAPFCGLNITTGYDEMALIVAAGDVDTLANHFTYAAMSIGVVLNSRKRAEILFGNILENTRFREFE
jgi:hypothetical protein